MPISRAGLDIALSRSGRQADGQVDGRDVGPAARRAGNAELDAQRPHARRDRHPDRGRLRARLPPLQRQDRRRREVRRRPWPGGSGELAPKAHLWVDANGQYDLATALEAAPKLADAGVDVLEAPLRPNRISGYQALKKQGALPITMDEGVISPVEAEEFIRLGMVDGLTVKVSRCGGLASGQAADRARPGRRALLAL